jgi:hypothetical protein
MTRSAADGLTSENTSLGNNRDPKRPVLVGSELFQEQKKYFESPLLVYPDSQRIRRNPLPNGAIRILPSE